MASSCAQAQVTACVHIANENVVSNDYFFDIYLNTTAGTSGDLYLGNADFRIQFSAGNFTSPVLSAHTDAMGNNFCTFVPRTSNFLNDLITQTNYFNSTATSISGDQLIINLNGPTPGSQTAFNTSVAKIDGTVSSHRLGRFKISGYNSGGAGLSWQLTGSLRTKVFTLGDATPWLSTEAGISVCTPLPIELLSFTAEREDDRTVRLDWATTQEVNNDYFIIQKRMPDGIFGEVGRTVGAGTTSEPQYYRHYDRTPMQAVNYYRLRQVDFDGTFSYSSVVEVKMDNKDLLAYPNPTNDLLFFQLPADMKGYVQANLFDIQGRLVRSDSWALPMQDSPALKMGDLPPGTYFYQVQSHLYQWQGLVVRESD